jgi:hypothetical protein
MKYIIRFDNYKFIIVIITTILMVSSIFLFIITPVNAQVIDIEVEVNTVLDHHEVTAKYDIEFENPTVVTGNLTCNVSGLDSEHFYVEVRLGLKDDLNWSPAINPKKFSFNQSIVIPFNITFFVPCEEDNRTVNRIRVVGSWVVKPYLREPLAKGQVGQDYFDATVYRKSAVRGGTSVKGPDEPIDEPRGFFEVVGLALIPILAVPVIILIVILYKKKKKRDLELRKQAIEQLKLEKKI